MSRNRLKEARLLAMRIPLPPLDEQSRIVARIEEVAARVEEARRLREGLADATRALPRTVLSQVTADPRTTIVLGDGHV